ncbi:DoxX family protein [Streptomyces sp. NPDC127119]|uniref:DoxX family protein n=1 Tax=Streptomyces sp. NPDC127119 TaxID=3345370 RepID=UPI00363AC22D
MFIAYAIVAALMSAVLLTSAGAKFTRPKRLVDQMSAIGLPYGVLPFLGIAQTAGTGGLVIGLWWAPLGIAAAIALTLYFIGAVAAHLRARDYKGAPPAAVLTAVAIALIALRVSSL